MAVPTKPAAKPQPHKDHAHHDHDGHGHDGHDHDAKPSLFSRLFGKR